MKGQGTSTSKLTSAAVMFMLMLCCRSATSAGIHQRVEESSSSSPISSPTNPTERTTSFLDCEYALGHTLLSCVDDIIRSIFHWSLQLDRPCCNAMVDVGFDCLNIKAPFTAYTIDDYKEYCFRAYGIKYVSTTAASATLQQDQQQQLHAAVHQGADQVVLLSPSTTPLSIVRQEIHQCFSTFKSIEGCLECVIQSFLTEKVEIIRPACCKAIIKVNDKCWPNIFPLNPFFPPLLTDYCRNFVQVVTAAAIGPVLEGLGL